MQIRDGADQDEEVASEELSGGGLVVGCSFEDVFGLLRVDEASDVSDPRLPLDHHQPLNVLAERQEPRVSLKVWTFGSVLGHEQVVPGVFLHEVGKNRDDHAVGAIIAREPAVDCLQLLPDPDAGVLGVVSVEGTVGGQDEEEVAVVAGEVLVAEVVGVVVAEVGPHRHIHLLPEVDEQVREELVLARTEGHLELPIGVCEVGGVARGGGSDDLVLGVAEVEEEVVELEDEEEGLRPERCHPIRSISINYPYLTIDLLLCQRLTQKDCRTIDSFQRRRKQGIS